MRSSCPHSESRCNEFMGTRSSIETSQPCAEAFRPPGRLQGFLHVHAVIHHVRHELRMGKRLIGPPMMPKRDMLIAALHERGDNGVEWALASARTSGWFGLERKPEAAILQNEIPFLRLLRRNRKLEQRFRIQLAMFPF